MAEILLAIPYPLELSRGNAVSARRFKGHLEALGHKVRVIPGDALCVDHGSANAMLALHARKSFEAIHSFHAGNPGRPIILVLTGSDLYTDLATPGPRAERVEEAMEMAHTLVVAQEASLADIPQKHRAKSVVIPKSLGDSYLPERRPHGGEHLEILMPSHLRAAKAPELILEALPEIPESLPIRITHCGEAEEDSLGARARRATEARHSRYRWIGGLSAEDALDALSRADMCLNTSRVEGGANALCEAIHLGVPCLATDISPNVGMLGDGHPGLFPVDDPMALAERITRAANEAAFVRALTEATSSRAPLFTRETERRALRDVLERALT